MSLADPNGFTTATAPEALSAFDELKRGWRPLIACAVGIGLGLSPVPAYTAGIFATALQKGFDWSRGEILTSLMFIPVALLLLGSSVGRLVDRIGARKVAIVSTIGLSLSFVLLATISHHIGHFYAAWAVLAVVSLGTLPTTYARVINSWFDKGRGLALGLALAGTGITGAVAPFYLNWAIGNYGWRIGYLAYGALPLCVAVPVLLAWLREAPQLTRSEASPATNGVRVGEALRNYRFWAIAFAALALAAGTSGLMPNLIPLLTDRGLTQADAMRAMAALALSVTGGRLLSGVLLDRLWAPIVCLILVAPAVIALVLLGQHGTSHAVITGSAIMIGLVAGAEFDLVAYLVGRYFGQRHFSELYGIQYAVFGLGAGFAPACYGAIRDHVGNYDVAIWMSVALFVVATGVLMTIGRYPKRFQARM